MPKKKNADKKLERERERGGDREREVIKNYEISNGFVEIISWWDRESPKWAFEFRRTFIEIPIKDHQHDR